MLRLFNHLDLGWKNLFALVACGLFGLCFGLVFKLGLDHPYDKMVHIAYFVTVTIVFTRILKGRYVFASLAAICLGIAGEVAQSHTGVRFGSLGDLLANTFGIVAAAALYALVKSETRIAKRDYGTHAAAIEPLHQPAATPARIHLMKK
ncbi:hypothetical protein E1162_14525 [Rhodobacteraceae bacterium RKSG542]|uniref:hypothetical protein n=1 Tax=Pseudovibrio flavus TaxID=2529854 RepID=UPI0012BBC974|nr:hypothetical protein [Pseudovibrio flavus]MTI18456.1 hypothetical protein [Pseudovibrio flavus]